jgi:hypothetical protein
VALARSAPPDGRKHWSWRLLADTLVQRGMSAPISVATMRRTLRRHGVPELSNRGRRRLDGTQEIILLHLARSAPPAGHGYWTYQRLADALVERGVVESISPETVRRTLRKLDPNLLDRWSQDF